MKLPTSIENILNENIVENRIHIVSYPGPDRSISKKSIEDKNMIARNIEIVELENF